MSWQLRGKRRYYVRSVWLDGRSETHYYGRGPAAALAERLDEQDRERRRLQDEAILTEAARLAAPVAALRALDDACDLMIRAILTAAGFHRPNYCAWRRRRDRS